MPDTSVSCCFITGPAHILLMEKRWFPSCALVPVLILLLVQYCSTFPIAQSNITTDQEALVALKAHITLDPNNVVTHNWSAATSCCSWIGVTCGVRHQRVRALNLTNMGLGGTLPPHLGNLSFLVAFSIRSNSFDGHLPDELLFLRRLKAINLGFNNFSGEVPLWLGSLPRLNHLYLQHNQFYGQISSSGLNKCRQVQILSLSGNSNITGSIPAEIGNLTMLKELYLREINLKGVIPEEMGNLINLEILDLQINNLQGPIPSAIFNISSLKILALVQNNLSGTLPEDAGFHLPFLEQFHLSFNQVTGPIPSSFWLCRKLTYLSLFGNMFTGRIPREFGNFTMIEEIHLGSNNLQGEIPQEIGNLGNLLLLDFHMNNLTGFIPSKIFNMSTMLVVKMSLNNLLGQLPSSLLLPNLQILDLWGNKISGVIPSSITNSSMLTDLVLAQNSLTGIVPNQLGNLRFLNWLDLSRNLLTSSESPSLELAFITSLTNCRYLERVVVSNNPLNGILPPSIGNFSTNLTYFAAINCNIRGIIPREIGNLSKLLSLGLGGNELGGYIPTTIGMLQDVQRLNVAQNRLQGSIPDEVCRLGNLVYFVANGNNLTQSIPECVGDLSSLRYLYLQSNRLTSTIPSSLWSLIYILQLNLSTNSLSGKLSVDVGNLKVATQVDLSRNELSGDIPSSIGGLEDLVNLSLAHNQLQGTIPQSFGELKSLDLLDLSNNSLSGAIPKSLEELSHLSHLNLSLNKLEGEIPEGGPFANFSAQSFLKNVALCGAPRLQVARCKSRAATRSKTRVRVILLKYILPAFASTLLGVVVLIFALRRYQKRPPLQLPARVESSPLPLRRVSYQELLQGSDGFCESNLLGTGGFSSVYRGILSDGLIVAIKVFNLQLEGGFQSFDTECQVLRNIRHRNLVKIISSCSNLDFRSLVLEYMPNGSLDKWLYSHNNSLDLLQRINIMIDVALALEYLHHGHSTSIVHCDLKPSNVLLDADMVAHVTDFGISKLFSEDKSMTLTKTLATVGYMAPEYGSQGIVTTRGDVYSYGILLMETFTRKKPTDEMFSGELNLKDWIKEALPHGVVQVVDTNLVNGKLHFSAKIDCMSSILELAVNCCVEIPEERMEMNLVLATLNTIRTKFIVGTSDNLRSKDD